MCSAFTAAVRYAINCTLRTHLRNHVFVSISLARCFARVCFARDLWCTAFRAWRDCGHVCVVLSGRRTLVTEAVDACMLIHKESG